MHLQLLGQPADQRPGIARATHLAAGRTFDEFHDRRRPEHGAVLGRSIATRLGVGFLDRQPAIFIYGAP